LSAADRVVDLLREHGLTLATAESLTAGLLASTIAEVTGCSSVLRGGVVAYATDVKHTALGVDERILKQVVSEAVAVGMAIGATRVLGSDIGVGTTGVAGPDWLDGQAPGTVWIAVHDARGIRTQARLLRLSGTREEIRHGTVEACLAAIEDVVGESAP
jgi:nicotinamide-nucleotide amidase